MARVLLFARNGAPFCVVDSAVGRGAPNQRLDVLVVQFFLRALAVDAGQEKAYLPPGEKLITIDGVCGEHTITYIKFFQQENNRRNPGVNLKEDSRVDPLTSGTFISSISHSPYTIIQLNKTYRTRFKSFAANPILDPLFPKDLTRSMYML